MTFFYDINKRLADLDQNKPILNESQQQVDEKYMGFDKTVAAIKKGGSAENPEAVAAAIGRKKYGKERFQKAAAAGKKLGEQGVAEGKTNKELNEVSPEYALRAADAVYTPGSEEGKKIERYKNQEYILSAPLRAKLDRRSKLEKYATDKATKIRPMVMVIATGRSIEGSDAYLRKYLLQNFPQIINMGNINLAVNLIRMVRDNQLDNEKAGYYLSINRMPPAQQPSTPSTPTTTTEAIGPIKRIAEPVTGYSDLSGNAKILSRRVMEAFKDPRLVAELLSIARRIEEIEPSSISRVISYFLGPKSPYESADPNKEKLREFLKRHLRPLIATDIALESNGSRNKLPEGQGVVEGKAAVPWQVVINALSSGYPDSDPTDSLAPIMRKYGVEFDDLNLLARRNGYDDIYAVLDDFGQDRGLAEGKGKKPDYIDLDGDGDRKESMKKAAADKKKHRKVSENVHRLLHPHFGNPSPDYFDDNDRVSNLISAIDKIKNKNNLSDQDNRDLQELEKMLDYYTARIGTTAADARLTRARRNIIAQRQEQSKIEQARDAAYRDARRGIAGMTEGSKELGDEFAAMLSGMGKSFRRGPAPRKPESAPRDYSADIAALPELRAQYEELMRKFKSLGGSSYQYADREQNLSDSERQARDLWNGPIQDLRRKINAAEKAQGEQGMTEDEMGEGNEFSGALAQARATGQKEFEVDGRTYPVNEGRVERTDQGVRHHGNYGTEYQGDDDEDESPAKKRTKDGDDKGGGKKRGRPAAARDTYNAPFGTVDIPKWKGPKTVHKIGDAEPGKKAPQRGRPKKVREQDDMIDIVDRGEYDREGDMAHDQLRTVMDAAKELRGILRADENLPEWVQSKITKALDYIDTARDYMKSQKSSDMEPVTEKAVSQAQQQAAGIALAARKSGKKPQAGTASAEMAKMPEKELEKFASTKHKGLPKKVKETTTSGSVAVADTAEPKKAKGKSSVSFGKGIYDSWNRELEQMISESMNITVTQSTSDTGEIDKSISVNATGDDAVRLAQLLSLAGMEGHHDHEDHSCPTCGQEPCGCAEIVDENSPDWPTNTEYNQDSLQYSGGLNRPKSTGQTTVPVIASQLDRQMSESTDLDYIKKMLG